LPEVAEDVTSEEFDFGGVIEGAGLDEAGAFVLEETEANGDDVALVLVAHEENLGLFLADFPFGELEADVVLVGLDEGGDGGGNFEGVARGAFVWGNGFEKFQDLAGGDGGSATGKTPAGGVHEVGGVFAEFGEAGNGLLFFLPAAKTGDAPVGEVLFDDGSAGELGSENFLDAGKGVEPGKDFGGGLAVFEAAVEFFADEFGETGDFADRGVLVFHKFFIGHRDAEGAEVLADGHRLVAG